MNEVANNTTETKPIETVSPLDEMNGAFDKARDAINEDAKQEVDESTSKSSKTNAEDQQTGKQSGKETDMTPDTEQRDGSEADAKSDGNPNQDEKPFKEFVENFVSDLETDEAKAEFRKSLENYDKFTKSNVQKAQKLAEDRKSFDHVSKLIKSDTIMNTFETLSKRSDFTDFIEQAVDYFDGDEGIKTFFDAFKESADSRDELHKVQENEDFSQQVNDVQTLDMVYQDVKEIEKLAVYADQNRLPSLQLAHRLREAHNQSEKLTGDNKDLKAKVKNLEAEIKKMNGKQSNHKTTSGKGTDKVSAASKAYGDMETAMDKARDRIRNG